MIWKGRAKVDHLHSSLDQFNRIVLGIQNDLYNLALYITGDKEIACSIIERCAVDWFNSQEWKKPNFRLSALKCVFQKCCGLGAQSKGNQSLPPFAVGLSEDERTALILVDCLQYSYQEAAFIWSRPAAYLAHALASGRCQAARKDLISTL